MTREASYKILLVNLCKNPTPRAILACSDRFRLTFKFTNSQLLPSFTFKSSSSRATAVCE
jgi:hypothetical protein